MFLTVPAFNVSALTVVSPNGGETWTIGCAYAIQWLPDNTAGTVKIELFNNNVFCLTICPQVPPTMTTYTWVPPVSLVPGNAYKVKISSLTSAAGFDFSDGNFTINQGSIMVTSPNGGETWQKGSTHQVLWTDNICDNVRIELWKGGTYNSLITASTLSNGSFTWAIPNVNTLVPGSDYKIKVLSVSNVAGTTGTVFDFSDANFTIGAAPTLIVVTPNGGENWYGGGTYSITWIDAIAEPVRIELWKGGSLNSTITASATGPFSWTIPSATVPGTDYKVKVIGLTTSASFDFSDNNFSISQGSFITVTSPNGGEVWAKGSTHIITWLDNISWNVRVELWKGGAYHSLINASTPSTGSCYWAIPATIAAGADYKVKIYAVSNSGTTLFDFSDNNFTIVGPTPSPAVTPSAGVKTYPNPCNNLLNVKFQEGTGSAVVVEVLNFYGNLLLHQEAGSVTADETMELNTSNLPEGNYLLVVKSGGNIVSRNNILIRH